jgi:hypothetical protein
MLPLSDEALEELEALQGQLQEIEYDQERGDKWKPVWGSKYTSRKYYNHVFSNFEAHPIYNIIWKSRCTPRIIFFCVAHPCGQTEHKNHATTEAYQHTR